MLRRMGERGREEGKKRRDKRGMRREKGQGKKGSMMWKE